jgi:hypothetical protein
MNDLSGAKIALEKAIQQDKDYARAYYVLAIVGPAPLTTTSSSPTSAGPSKQTAPSPKKAQKDLEFRKQRESAEFKAALNP